MKLTASLLASAVAALSLTTLAAHATPLQPFGTGTVLLVNGTALDSATSLTGVANGFRFTTNDSLITVTYLATPVLGVFNFTDVCASLSVGIGPIVLGSPCKAVSVSFSDANFGLVNVGAAVGLNVSESVTGNVAQINVGQNGLLGAETAAFAFVGPVQSGDPGNGGGAGNSPVPEPGTLSLMATGLLGAAGAVRRRFMA